MISTTDHIKSAMIELLSQFGRTSEALSYLKKFSNTEPHRFAIIKIGGGVLANHLDDIVKALAFMQNMGLVPILVHGAGPQLDSVLTEHGAGTRRVDGMRVTDDAVIKHLRKVMYDESHKLIDALEAHNVKARAFHHGVFECSYLDQEKYGYVGTPDAIHMDGIVRAAKAGSIPVITPLGETESGQMMNINADTATQALAKEIQPQKLVFLTPSAGIWNERGDIIPAVNLATDYEGLIAQPWVEGGMRVKLQEIYALLENLPSNSSVSITSADKLTRELFTHQGAGTLVRKGETLYVQESISQEDKKPIIALLEKCFNRKLKADYFDDLQLKEVIWSKSKRAVAIITEGIGGVSYLDKFAVTPAAQGEGLGAALWGEIIKRHPALFWRSRINNPINNWYVKKADHMSRQQNWLVLSYGIDDKDLLDQFKQEALKHPDSWQDDMREIKA